MPIFRSDTQARILAALYLPPRPQLTLTDLAQQAGATTSAIHYEVDRLEGAQFVTTRRDSNRRLVSANDELPIAAPLTEILDYTYGPITAITNALAELPEVEEAYIFGSWAARYRGVDGPPPHDIDVLLIGTTDRRTVGALSTDLSRQLGRDVSPYRTTPQAWQADECDPFLGNVRSNPLVKVKSPR